MAGPPSLQLNELTAENTTAALQFAQTQDDAFLMRSEDVRN